MEKTVEEDTVAQPILFRPSKKRKIYRQRAATDDDETVQTSAPNTTTLAVPAQQHSSSEISPSAPLLTDDRDGFRGRSDSVEVEGTKVPMSEILRLRKLHKHRVGGVEFRAATANQRLDSTSTSMALVPADGSEEYRTEEGQIQSHAPGGVRHFAKQTGFVGDVDKHMMAYIDSELSKRRQVVAATQTPTNDHGAQASSSSSTRIPNTFSEPAHQSLQTEDKDTIQRQPAALGKLQEIDLGNEARDRNVSRTEMARRRAAGEEVEDEEASQRAGKPKKVRLGRDGKPWRPRKRRNSDDVKRDQLVEAVMRENRLEIYEPPPPQTGQGGEKPAGENEDADEEIAEAFRRDFMDAVSSRQRKRQNATTSGTKNAKKGDEDVLKGPKLGGSRSARAAMRDIMLKAQQAAGKK